MNAHSQELTTSLSTDTAWVARALVGKNFIQNEVLLEMLSDDTPTGKAAILVEAVRNEIEIVPEMFTEFLEILSEQSWAKEVVESLRSTYQSEFCVRSRWDDIKCTCQCYMYLLHMGLGRGICRGFVSKSGPRP